MNKKINILFSVLLTGIIGSAEIDAQNASSKSNVILIMVDDMGY